MLKKSVLIVVFFALSGVCLGQKPAINAKALHPVTPNTRFGFLAKSLDSVRIVGLGEVSHYTKECYTYKHALIKALVKSAGFNTLVFEVDYGEAKKWNEYVYKGKGNLKEILSRCGWWTYQTKEFQDLLQFLHEYNKTASNKVQVYGMEMTYIKHNLDFLATYLQKYYAGYEKLKALLTKNRRHLAFQRHSPEEVKEYWTFYYKLASVVSQRKNLGNITNQEYQEVQRLVAILQQYCTYISQQEYFLQLELRDKFSVRNVQWTVEQNPKNKVIIWAHNAHIRKSYYYDALGRNLRNWYGNRYYAIGFAFGKGVFGAFNSQWKFSKWTYPLTKENSLNNQLFKHYKQDVYLDIRNYQASMRNTNFTLRNDISEQMQENRFNQVSTVNLSGIYDGLLFIRETHYPTSLK